MLYLKLRRHYVYILIISPSDRKLLYHNYKIHCHAQVFEAMIPDSVLSQLPSPVVRCSQHRAHHIAKHRHTAESAEGRTGQWLLTLTDSLPLNLTRILGS